MHVKDDRVFGGIEFLAQCIEACDVFAAEINLNAPPLAPIIFQLPFGQSLQDFIPPNRFHRLRRLFLRAFQLDLLQLQFLKPIALLGLLQQQFLNEDRPQALDLTLWTIAQQQGKRCIGLEENQSQEHLLTEMDMDVQLKMLYDMARNISHFRRHSKKLTARYEREEIRQLYQSTKKGLHQQKRQLLYQRNEIMANRIAAIAKKEYLFAGVGAAHLAGSKGVLRLLKHKGFKLSPISLSSFQSSQ